MVTKKPAVDQKTALITTGVITAAIALFTFLPVTKPVVIAACTTLIEQEDGAVVPAEEVSSTTVE